MSAESARGAPLPRRVTLVRAANPSPMTLDGTNTWVLVEPGHQRAVVVDPGPDDAAHRAAIFDAAARAGGRDIGLVLLTHGHPDHAEGAVGFATQAHAPLRAIDVTWCRDSGPLADGEQLAIDGLTIDVVAAPGHTADSACYLLAGDAPSDRALLTGDTVLGRGSTVVARPDGRLADYLDTLRRLHVLVGQRQLGLLLPGHGPVRHDPAEVIDGYLAHRAERLDQVRAAIADAAPTVEAVLAAVYGDIDASLLPAARWSLLAQLDYLKELGEPVPADGR